MSTTPTAQSRSFALCAEHDDQNPADQIRASAKATGGWPDGTPYDIWAPQSVKSRPCLKSRPGPVQDVDPGMGAGCSTATFPLLR